MDCWTLPSALSAALTGPEIPRAFVTAAIGLKMASDALRLAPKGEAKALWYS
ncbi:MAG: hypothetical protein ACYDGN_00615 [Acidimicrobiales bacterium]